MNENTLSYLYQCALWQEGDEFYCLMEIQGKKFISHDRDKKAAIRLAGGKMINYIAENQSKVPSVYPVYQNQENLSEKDKFFRANYPS